MRIKLGKEQIKEYIEHLNVSSDPKDMKFHIKNVQEKLELLDEPKLLAEYKKETIYQENNFSPKATIISITQAKENAVSFLVKLLTKIDKNEINNQNDDIITESIAVNIINRILVNFYSHIEEMYQSKVHGKANITKEKLDEIKIGNEYDVQRILYSIIKPIFPEARVEVPDDTGYGSVRYDIFIEKFNIVIEVKCSRPSMSDKSLREELGSDIYHYKLSNVFFFIYDKNKIVTNRVAFENTYNGKFDGKNIKTVLIQPISL